MADYLVTGKKGNGKSIFAVGVIMDALREGKRVATNLDIHMDKIETDKKFYITRLPDCPTVADLEALGRGQEGVIEEENGVIVLDEVSKIFNARAWGDKDRQPVLDWLVHSRKLGWDVYMIAQGPEQLDKQLRTSLLEYWVVVKRTDKWPIPIVTSLSKVLRDFPPLNFIIPKDGIRFPRRHIGTIRHGFDPNALVVDRKWYKGRDLYHLYNTQQMFLDRDHPRATLAHSQLSPCYFKQPEKLTLLEKLHRFLFPAPTVEPLPPADPHPLVVLLRKLPEAERLKHWRRLEALGAFDRPANDFDFIQAA